MCSAFQVDETLDEVGKDLQEAEEMEKILGLFLKVRPLLLFSRLASSLQSS